MTVSKSRGWRRMHELRAEDEAAKQLIIDGLIKDLGREPTTMTGSHVSKSRR